MQNNKRQFQNMNGIFSKLLTDSVFFFSTIYEDKDNLKAIWGIYTNIAKRSY